jgi:hypothetical protein
MRRAFSVVARKRQPLRRLLGGLSFVATAAVVCPAHPAPPLAAPRAFVLAHQRTGALDALHTSGALLDVGAADPSAATAHLAIDGQADTAWSGRPGEPQWKWGATFARPSHIGLLRARFGLSPTSGVPTVFRWEVRRAPVGHDGRRSGWAGACPAVPLESDEGWLPLLDLDPSPTASAELLAQPTRRSWFVDVEACALRLVVDRTNAGPPAIREVQAIEGARDVLRWGIARDDGAYPGFLAADAIDGTYARRWAGAPGRARWSLRVDLPEPQPVDRIRLVLGFDATTMPRAEHGRTYAIAWGPVRYSLEVSEDGRRFTPIASEPTREGGAILPVRRRLVTLPVPRTIRALRLVMNGATGASGLPEAGAVPVVREIAAYRADDPRPILASPWLLSVNANPSAESHSTPGGEVTNDAYWAKFLQARFTDLVPALLRDDRYARALDERGQPLGAPPNDEAGQVLESIEGDDPQLDVRFLSLSSPPPIAVLSGSDDWDYAAETGPDRLRPRFWHWDPLRDPRGGGIGQLGPAVAERVAPFMGFCGGAQILALLEARGGESAPEDDLRTIDRVLRRTSGRPIRGFAPLVDIERAWPTDLHPPRAKIQFVPTDPLFMDVAGPLRRSTTQALPESHSDVVRPDAFLPGGPLQRLEVLATSAFCGPAVVAAGERDGGFPNPSGPGWCDTVPEVFRSRDPAWPLIATQFHAEQRDFASPGPGDPPESIADARLFLAGAYDSMVDAYLKLAP